jgi:hypothetical protein
MLLFVQVYVVPDKELLKLNAPVDEPAQKVWLEGTVIVGAELTTTCFVTVVVPHSFVTSSDIVNVPDDV